jgi:hypothetical protein
MNFIAIMASMLMPFCALHNQSHLGARSAMAGLQLE